MITLVEALNYRCLRYVSQPMRPFHVLVGPNASGKTTFLDVIGFLSDMVSNSLEYALSKRTPDLLDLLFQRKGNQLELAVEAEVPEHIRQLAKIPPDNIVRYQVAICLGEERKGFELAAETLMLKQSTPAPTPPQRSLFPQPPKAPESLRESIRKHGNKVLVNKTAGGNDFFYSELPGKKWTPSFKLGPGKSALSNLPADETYFPTATWFREYLALGVQEFILNSRKIKRPNPPRHISGFLPDGSNLSWVVARLRKENPDQHQRWIQHLRTVLSDLVDIKTIERPEDRHSYMVYHYKDDFAVPSWLVSDGTLRLTALTLPAYLPDLRGIYLIEEPENGIHPRAIATVYDSLSSMYDTQVLLTTHSPVMLNVAEAEDLLCFARDPEGATDIVLGEAHPKLREWQHETDLGTLLASGVLG